MNNASILRLYRLTNKKYHNEHTNDFLKKYASIVRLSIARNHAHISANTLYVFWGKIADTNDLSREDEAARLPHIYIYMKMFINTNIRVKSYRQRNGGSHGALSASRSPIHHIAITSSTSSPSIYICLMQFTWKWK